VLEAVLDADAIGIPPGGSGDLPLRLTSSAHGRLHVEVQTLTPYDAWDTAPRWSVSLAIAGPDTITHRVGLRVPAHARPGRYWVLVKVMGGGDVVYTPAIPLIVLAPVTTDIAAG
jgi:hypothetical protein